MNTAFAIYAVVASTVLVAMLAGLAAYMRHIDGKVPLAIAAGIEAGLKSLSRGPINILAPASPPGIAAGLLQGPEPIAGSGHIAASVSPWYPAGYIPAWSQLAGPLPDGNADPEMDNDCGETCVAMIVAGVHGVPMDPGGVRQFLHGPAGTGLTDGQELVNALAHYSTAAHVDRATGDGAYQIMASALNTERPVIMLGRWASVGGALHWMVATKVHPDRVEYCNPWGGTRSYTLRADWLVQYAGQLVVLDSHIHYDCRAWPQPT